MKGVANGESGNLGNEENRGNFLAAAIGGEMMEASGEVIAEAEVVGATELEENVGEGCLEGTVELEVELKALVRKFRAAIEL